jgi:hypothetical protein
MTSTTNDSKAGEAQPLLPTKTETTKGDDNDTHPTILNDAYDTVILGIPIFFSMLSWVGMKTTDSALLGHVSSQALSAAALSDLVRVCHHLQRVAWHKMILFVTFVLILLSLSLLFLIMVAIKLVDDVHGGVNEWRCIKYIM